MTEERLKEFGSLVVRLIQGENLSCEEAKEMFRQVLLDEQPELQQGAFLAALTAKGETAEEIAAAWEAIYELDTVKVTPDVPQPLVENCGTGMDTMKTFNISTVAAVIAAAGGVCMAKHGARALTSTCGAVDILEAVGVDVECEVDVVKRSIEEAGIGMFNGMSPKVHPRALFRILSQIRFGTTLNIAGSLANPALPHYGVRGVHSPELVAPVSRVMRDIGYQRALVFHGSNGNGRGMDELSTLGDTMISELTAEGDIKKLSLNAQDLGIDRPTPEAIGPSADRDEESVSFVAVLAALERGPKEQIACLNAAPMFYLTGQAKDLREGFYHARDLVRSGEALKKLKTWVGTQNRDPKAGTNKLEGILARCYA